MKLCFSLFFSFICKVVSSYSNLSLSSEVTTNYYFQSLENMESHQGKPESPSSEVVDPPVENNEVSKIDFKICSLVLGTYCCQALLLNSAFLLISNMSQWMQKQLNVDTSSILSGRISGILTVTFGSYVSYKLSELFVDKILSLFKEGSTASILKQIIKPAKSNLTCINVPIFIFYKFSKYLHNQIPFNLGSIDIHIKNQIMKFNKTPNDVKENLQISVKCNKLTKKKFKREFAIISTYSLATFFFLGGSELSHPGAYSIPKLSLEAEGYNYATKTQKRIIQIIGRKYGCHTCGLVSETERYIADHQPPSGVVKRKLKGKYISFLLRNNILPIHMVKPKQHFYPQCNRCSLKQSKAVAKNRRESVTHYGRFRPYHLCPNFFFATRIIFDTRWSKLNRKVK